MNESSRDINIRKKIDAYLKGKLREDEVDALWEEIFKNPRYLEYLQTEVTVQSIVNDKRDSSSDKNSSGNNNSAAGPNILRDRRKWYTLAAAVILFTTFIYLFPKVSGDSVRGMAIKKIAITEIESPDVKRSAKQNIKDSDSLLNLGFDAAVSGDMGRAIKIFTNITEKYKNTTHSAEAYLNLGILFYNQENFDKAARSFNKAAELFKQNDALTEKAWFYLGNTYIMQNKYNSARKALKKTVKFKGKHQNVASALLEEMNDAN